MLADVLEGMRGRMVTELERRATFAERRWLPDSGRRARLDAHVGQVIDALRGGRPLAPVCTAVDLELELTEHELLETYLNEQIAKRCPDVAPSEHATVGGWRCQADRRCLREQNKRLMAMLDEVHESAAMLTPDGRILYCNRQAAMALRQSAGVPPPQLIGKTTAELGLPIERIVGRPVGDLVQLARSHEGFEVSTSGRAMESRFDAIYGNDGAVDAVALLVRDVHNRKQAQLRVDLLTKLSTLIGVLDYDQVAQGLVHVPIPELADWCAFSIVENDRIRQTYIATRDPSLAPLREAISRAVPGWDRHPLWQEMLTGGFQLLTEVSDDFVRRISVSADQYCLLSQVGIRSLMIVPLVTRAKVTGIMTFVYTTLSGRRYTGDDPTLAEEMTLHAARALENARLMKELRASEARFRVALGGARTIVFEQDAALRYTWYYNPLAPDDPRGKAPEDLLPPEEASALTRTKKRVLENGEAVNEEVDLTLWGDERRHYREAIEPMRDQTGKVVGIIGAATDITEHQRLKQQLTDDIGFRERMMGVLSHDLRNPLNAITMAADLLLRVDDRQERDRTQLQRIRRAADRMKEMIETLLDFTRLRYLGAFPTTPAAVDLGNIARVAVDELAGSRPGSHVELRVEGDLHGEWDPARVAQAISNLVGNALAYGTSGTVVDVLVQGEGDDVFVKVTNQGEPIPSALKAVLFEPFRRGVIGDRSPHGLGLGLYIVNAIVTAHGGEIHVESTVDVGTTFTIRLPRKAAAPIND